MGAPNCCTFARGRKAQDHEEERAQPHRTRIYMFQSVARGRVRPFVLHLDSPVLCSPGPQPLAAKAEQASDSNDNSMQVLYIWQQEEGCQAAEEAPREPWISYPSDQSLQMP